MALSTKRPLSARSASSVRSFSSLGSPYRCPSPRPYSARASSRHTHNHNHNHDHRGTPSRPNSATSFTRVPSHGTQRPTYRTIQDSVLPLVYEPYTALVRKWFREVLQPPQQRNVMDVFADIVDHAHEHRRSPRPSSSAGGSYQDAVAATVRVEDILDSNIILRWLKTASRMQMEQYKKYVTSLSVFVKNTSPETMYKNMFKGRNQYSTAKSDTSRVSSNRRTPISRNRVREAWNSPRDVKDDNQPSESDGQSLPNNVSSSNSNKPSPPPSPTQSSSSTPHPSSPQPSQSRNRKTVSSSSSSNVQNNKTTPHYPSQKSRKSKPPFGTHIQTKEMSTTHDTFRNHGVQFQEWDNHDRDDDFDIPSPPPSPSAPAKFHWLQVRHRGRSKKKNPKKNRETEYQRSMNEPVAFRRALAKKKKRDPFTVSRASNQQVATHPTPYATLSAKPTLTTEYMAMSSSDVFERHLHLSGSIS